MSSYSNAGKFTPRRLSILVLIATLLPVAGDRQLLQDVSANDDPAPPIAMVQSFSQVSKRGKAPQAVANSNAVDAAPGDGAQAKDLANDSSALVREEVAVPVPSGASLAEGKAAAEAVGEEAVPAAAVAAAVDVVSAFSFKACVAEFIAMTLFVWVGCGSAMSIAKQEGSAWILQVSLAFGLMITTLAYAIGHYSGGHINCAVTLALWVSGQIGFFQALGNFIAQCLGSVFGALILHTMYKEENDRTGGLATNAVAEGWSKMGALVGEVMGTFILVYVVHETAVNPVAAPNAAMAPIAIGVAVFLAHVVLIPVDGCSINPTRSLGPAIVCSLFRKGDPAWRDMWVFWVGPCAGALLASLVYFLMH